MMEKQEKQGKQEGFVDIEKKKQEYVEELKKGGPEEVEERRRQLYEGKDLTVSTSEQMEIPEKELSGPPIDIEAFRKAYLEYLKNPKEKAKPKPEDFVLKKEK
jgi:hypothetical protein